MTDQKPPYHVSLVAVEETMISTISGLFDVLNSFAVLGPHVKELPDDPPFVAEIVTPSATPVITASGLTLPGRPFGEVADTDIVIVSSLMPADSKWVQGRYPDLVDWFHRMRARGAILCSACTGILLLAETGLFDDQDVTIHPQLLDTCREQFPRLNLRPEHALVTSGDHEEFVSSGATTNWHDLVLYLIARYTGPTAAIEIARFFALQCHDKGQALYTVFVPPLEHGDAMVRDAQHWLHDHFVVDNAVQAVVARSRIPERTFKRRFRAATDHTPMEYVQRLRVEGAKRQLERTRTPVDEIGAAVGYQDPAFFRRLFKRLTNVPPGVYRRRFQLPEAGRTEKIPA